MNLGSGLAIQHYLCYIHFMARPLRIEFPGAIYHITSRGNAKQNIFFDEEDFNDFLVILCQITKRYQFVLHSYCLMRNHYHLLIETSEANLSRGMRQLNGTYGQHFNKKHQRVGHLFQGRYKSILIDKEDYLLQLSRYIALNPIRANLIKDPKDWSWSSYSQFIGFTKGIPCLFTDWILAQFGSKRKAAIKAYQKFVLSEIDVESPLRKVKGQLFLGSDQFMENIEHLIKEQEKLSEIPKRQRYVTRPSLDKLFLDKDRKDAQIYQAYRKYGYTLIDIAKHLAVHYATISRAIKRIEKRDKMFDCKT